MDGVGEAARPPDRLGQTGCEPSGGTPPRSNRMLASAASGGAGAAAARPKPGSAGRGSRVR
eukprot:4463308-Alexandrium_andersonii.AAC.1